MREALVIHCNLSIYAGGEFLCLYVCKVLQELNYHVSLVSDVYEPSKVEELYGMGDVLARCTHIPTPRPLTHMPSIVLALNRLSYAVRLAIFANQLKRNQYDVVISTQSSIFSFPQKRLYHFVFEVMDLFRYPMPLAKGSVVIGTWSKRTYLKLLGILYRILAGSPAPLWYLVSGRGSLGSLKEKGYTNSSLFYPPSRVVAMKLPKKKQIVQASRIAPEKRIEFLVDTARRLPQYRFFLVGRNLRTQQASNPGYAQRVLSNLPTNLSYVEATLRQTTLVEESKVYFHTGIERGQLTILFEAMSAGCLLVVPENGVAGELVRASGIGYQFKTVDEAVEKLLLAMEADSPWTPEEISEMGRRLSPGLFEKMITKIVQEGVVVEPSLDQK
jgi:glycosyltransferase involved in cell wall biosynthesis